MPPITINSGVELVGASLSTSNSISTHMFNKAFKVFSLKRVCPASADDLQQHHAVAVYICFLWQKNLGATPALWCDVPTAQQACIGVKKCPIWFSFWWLTVTILNNNGETVGCLCTYAVPATFLVVWWVLRLSQILIKSKSAIFRIKSLSRSTFSVLRSLWSIFLPWR